MCGFAAKCDGYFCNLLNSYFPCAFHYGNIPVFIYGCNSTFFAMLNYPFIVFIHAKEPDVAIQVRQRVVAAQMQRLDIGIEQPFLAAVLLGEQRFDHRRIDVEQRRQRAHVNDVLEQLPLPRIGVRRVADLGQRHADDDDVLAELGLGQRLGVVVEQIAAAVDRGDVFVPCLRIHRHHHVDAAAAAEIALVGDTHFVPRRQALDVRWENVPRRHRDAHPDDRLREQLVGRRRAGAVDVGELDDEIVDCLDWFDHGGILRSGGGWLHPCDGYRFAGSHPTPPA